MQKIFTTLAAVLLAAACHPHEIASHTGGDRVPVVLNGVALSSVATPAQAPPGERMTPTAAGTLFGAIITPDVQVILKLGDRAHVERAVIRAYNSAVGTMVEWRNEATGSYGTVTPASTDQTDEWLPCREFRLMTSASGQRSWTQQRACRQPDGTWARTAP